MTSKDLSRVEPTENDRLKRQCTAHKKNGERCRRAPIKGGTVCPKHGGKAPQVRAAAQRRLLEATDGLMANLIRIATSGETEANRLRATIDALNRAGLTERQVVQVAVTSPFDELLAGIIDAAVTDGRALPAGPTADEDDEPWDDEDGTGWEDDEGPGLSFNIPGTIEVPPVQNITTLPSSRPNPPPHLDAPPENGPSRGWADLS